ncbi:MAG: pentapeptide repeat-containing protein [Nostoc sp. DcaGUA01]|nr:pentapeptide repeat-containing protein [Nostoc sp. DcaGUA01]
MKIKWRSHVKPKPKKRRPSSEEDILHLRRTGRYIPPRPKSWRDKFIVVTKSPFLWIERRLIEPLANLVDGADVFRILEKVGFLIAVLVFLLEVGERREKSIFEAWQVVKDGQGEKSGVVVLALERLKKENFSLSGINVEKTNLMGVNLNSAFLMGANLRSADLGSADLNGALLMGANLKSADLSFANLSGAGLINANLSGANLKYANLSGADLSNANLSGANLHNANLNGADLAYQYGLSELGNELGVANLSGAKNLTPEQVKSAKNWEKAIYDKEFRAKLGLPPEAMK